MIKSQTDKGKRGERNKETCCCSLSRCTDRIASSTRTSSLTIFRSTSDKPSLLQLRKWGDSSHSIMSHFLREKEVLYSTAGANVQCKLHWHLSITWVLGNLASGPLPCMAFTSPIFVLSTLSTDIDCFTFQTQQRWS